MGLRDFSRKIKDRAKRFFNRIRKKDDSVSPASKDEKRDTPRDIPIDRPINRPTDYTIDSTDDNKTDTTEIKTLKSKIYFDYRTKRYRNTVTGRFASAKDYEKEVKKHKDEVLKQNLRSANPNATDAEIEAMFNKIKKLRQEQRDLRESDETEFRDRIDEIDDEIARAIDSL